MVIEIVVPRVDGALKDQVPDRGAQGRAASCRDNGVALGDDQGGGREGAADELVSWLMSIPRSAKRSSTLRSDSGYFTYIITTRRITSGELLKYRNGSLMA